MVPRSAAVELGGIGWRTMKHSGKWLSTFTIPTAKDTTWSTSRLRYSSTVFVLPELPLRRSRPPASHLSLAKQKSKSWSWLGETAQRDLKRQTLSPPGLFQFLAHMLTGQKNQPVITISDRTQRPTRIVKLSHY